ncbi:inorganic diphosphatase [Arenicella sp. 4NH20-0111]|uniref:inorganic diphosphatase n=1 Tax=Arenicella sp. 4NH20-0111 TaxID=3127648 RepID=UPI0031062A6F
MSLNEVGPGNSLPDDVNVIIEIPRYGDPIKYEVDKDSGAMFVDRFMSTAMHYPCNYGYVPQTLSDDGDPVDVLVLAPFPLVTGSVVRVRPIGVLQMEDEAGEDAKILAVPVEKLTKFYNNVSTFRDVQQEMLDKISHFFEHYKDLEQGKWVKVRGWAGKDEARQEIIDSAERYNNAEG